MMIEAIIIKYLNEKLGIPTSAEIPTSRPKKFIVVEEIDRGESNHIDAATISVYSYAETIYEAAKLNEDVIDEMSNIIVLDNISSCKLGGGGRSVDKDNKLPRYEAIFNIIYY